MKKRATGNVGLVPKNSNKVPVTERALFQRINRKLRKDGQQLRTARSQAVMDEVGRFYVVRFMAKSRASRINPWNNTLVLMDVDLERMGRKLAVLQPWEQLR